MQPQALSASVRLPMASVHGLRPRFGAAGELDHGNDPDQHDHEGGQRAVLEGAPRRMSIDERGQRFRVQRSQQQGRGKFLQAVHEHKERRARQRRLQQGQLHPEHQVARLRAQGAGRVLDSAGDAIEAGREGAGRNRQEADRIGDDDRPRRAHEHEAEALTREPAPDRVQKIVEADQRAEQAKGQDGPGHRISNAGDRLRGAGQVRFREPRGRDHDEPEEERRDAWRRSPG